MQRYEKYKDSGIDWLGEIPEHWEVKKITHLFKKIGSGTTPTAGSALYYDNGIINFLQTGDLNNNYIFSTSKKITERAFLDYSSLKIFPVGSLVIAMYGATIGKLGILKIEATTNQACCVLGEWQIGLDLKYIFYWFIFAKNQILSMSYGGGQPNISQDLIKSLRVHFPPFHEQKVISKFLDDKCEKIDATVVLKEQQIEKLRELRQITIHHAITKGIPHVKGEVVPTKDSGIDWIGEIPKHWEIKRLKYIFSILKRIAGREGYDVLSITQKGIKVKDVKSGEGQLAMDYSKYQLAYKGEFAMNHMDLLTGWVDISEHDGVISPDYRVFTLINNRNFSPYFLFVLQDCYSSKIFYAHGQGVSMLGRWRFPTENFNNFFFPIPPLTEQKAIVAFLQEQTSKIDKAIFQKQEQIVKLKEYKQSLINEVVTGKIKVAG